MERPTIWVFAPAVFALILPSFELTLSGGPDWWNVVLWIIGNIALLLAVGAPDRLDYRD